MKKIWLIFLTLIITSGSLFSQSGWFWQNPLPQGNDLNSIEITPEGTLFAGGYSGTIIKSIDGALNWETKSNVQQYTGWFHKLKFLNNNSGWAVGQDWALYYTTNKGGEWIKRYQNNSIILYDLFALNADTFWACGTNSSIIKTSNNWSTWVNQRYLPGEAYHLKSITFSDRNTGYCVGSTNGGTTGGIMFNTTNGGSIWNPVSVSVSASLECITYLPGNILVIATGKGDIFRSTNNGSSWTVIQLSPNNQFREIYFINPQTGWVVGTEGVIFKTTNSGLSWFLQTSSTLLNLYSIKFSDNNAGYAVGENGVILKTTNGGNTWNKRTEYLLNIEDCDIESLKFLDANKGYLFGWDGLIAKSVDGGSSWTGQQSNTTNHLTHSYFIDENNIWAAGYNGTLVKTTNGGDNWNVTPFPNTSRITGLDFPDIYTGYILTVSSRGFFKTTNSGLNWFVPLAGLSIEGGNSIFFTDSQTGFIVGAGGLINKTENGGGSWVAYHHTPAMELNSVFFINTSTGWVCGDGGLILKTSNGGTTWQQLFYNTNSLLKIMFVDENNGWCAGLYGRVIKTTNGGQNWLNILSGTYVWLQDIFFIDQNTGWITGGNDILKTINGGIVLSINSEGNITPANYILHQNYPNPFNPVTNIRFDIPSLTNTKIIIYDLLGRQITTLVNEQLKPGTYQVDWDASNYASGVYFYSLITEDFIETKRMVLIK